MILSVPGMRDIPGLADAVTGWMAWEFVDGLLRHGGVWTPRRARAAVCSFGCGPLVIPGETCSCGHAASRAFEDVGGDVVGVVAGWGRVVQGERGWRSQFAYPVRLLLSNAHGVEAALGLADRYGCKVEMTGALDRM